RGDSLVLSAIFDEGLPSLSAVPDWAHRLQSAATMESMPASNGPRLLALALALSFFPVACSDSPPTANVDGDRSSDAGMAEDTKVDLDADATPVPTDDADATSRALDADSGCACTSVDAGFPIGVQSLDCHCATPGACPSYDEALATCWPSSTPEFTRLETY